MVLIVATFCWVVLMLVWFCCRFVSFAINSVALFIIFRYDLFIVLISNCLFWIVYCDFLC